MRKRLNRTLAAVIGSAALLGASTRPTLGQNVAPVDYAHKILSNRPLPPTDTSLLYSPGSNYPDITYGVGGEPTEEGAFALLNIYLQEETRNSRSGYISGMLNMYDDLTVKQRVPNPSLRAALLALSSTLASPAVYFVLNAKTPAGLPKVKEIGFADLPGKIGTVTMDAQTQQMTILFDAASRGENPFLFTPLLAKLLLQQGPSFLETPTNPYYESLVPEALADLLYLEQLAGHPSLARTGTLLSVYLNFTATARFNSGLGSRLGLYATNGNALVIPRIDGGMHGWLSVFIRDGHTAPPISTPGNPLLAQYLQQLQQRGSPPPPPADFNQAVLDWLDQNQGVVPEEYLVNAATALELDVSFVRQ